MGSVHRPGWLLHLRKTDDRFGTLAFCTGTRGRGAASAQLFVSPTFDLLVQTMDQGRCEYDSEMNSVKTFGELTQGQGK